MAVSAVALLSLTVQPVMAQGKGGKDAILNACAAQREPLQKLDKEYADLKKSKMSAAIGEGLKSGAMVLAKGVASGGIPLGRGGGGFGGGLGGMGSLMGAVGGMAMQNAAAQQAQAGGAPGPAPAASMMFGQDMLTGAMGLNVPGVSGYGGFGGGGGDNMKAYAALAVLVAIVATADAYAKLKEQEAGGDLKKASFNIDQDAGRQLAVSRSIVDNGAALVECRSAQLTDINNRLASASNDKDRKAIKRERTELTGALKKDIDLTGGVVDQHANMAKTFTQGRAMTDGTSEAEVLGAQTPAYATAASVTKLSMPKAGAALAQDQAQQATPAAAPPPALVTVKAAVVRSAPVASASAVTSLPVGSPLQARTSAADGGWWEVDAGGQTGYVRASEVGPPGSAPAAPVQTAAKGGAKGKGAAAKPSPPPPPPAPVGPSNIRAYNQSVIAARDNGKGRLSSLMTDIQAAQRKESVFYAMISNWRLG
jgi:hypothetical protein